MTKFAFIIHPLDVGDVSRKFPWMKHLSDKMVENIMRCLPPFTASEITGVRSVLGEEVEGWFVACPLTARQMVQYPEHYVLKKIIKACKKAEKLGAEIIGLGAFTSVVGDKGISISRALNIPVTTGNSYTVATALESIILAAHEMGLDLKEERITVVGATGSIGRACSKILAEECTEINLLARTEKKLFELADELTAINPDIKVNIYLPEQMKECLSKSRIILSASGAVCELIQPEMLLPGSVVCDVARPRDVAVKVAEKRDDVLVIEGGVVMVPGPVEFNLDFGFPPKTSYACMAETMILALEKRFECYSLGPELELEKIREISDLARKHGFKLAGLRSFERAITPEVLKQIRNRVKEVI
ncbi:shikimate dehydrogenase [Anoxybacter fermentans]|uniref:Shikimate dehydrogenase n=1 Tax=Anoxybacter fermentans TaxID=1323375 RepID=A0A3Q9HSI0_9FIRM|nr:polysaccharide biosynthesis protein [Anoxybacter fermentans]AZR74674.1 shikimate dehydrogenase [Anoxybacter fermentans]